MLRRTWIASLMLVAATSLGADQAGSRILPILAPRDVGPDNAIYFADMGNASLIRVTDLTDEGWQQGPTVPDLRFSSPWHFTFDAAGRIFLADWGNYRIVQMTDIAGTGWGAFSGTGSNTFNRPNSYISSVGFDALGRMYVTGSERVVRVDNMSGAGWTALELGKRPGETGSSGNKDIAFDTQGRIYVTDNANHRIVRIDDMTGAGWVDFSRHGCPVEAGCNPPRIGPYFTVSPKGLQVRGTGATLTYQTVFPRITAGGGYRMALVGLNTSGAAIDAQIRLLRNAAGACRCAEPFPVAIDGASADSTERTIPPMGTVRLDVASATGWPRDTRQSARARRSRPSPS